MMRACLLAFVLMTGSGVSAQAEAPKPTAAPSEAATANAKACNGIENRLPKGESTSFKAKQTVYVWSEVKGAAGKDVFHVWKRDGQEFRRAKFYVEGQHWRMNSHLPNATKGGYLVEVVSGDQKLGEVSFTVE